MALESLPPLEDEADDVCPKCGGAGVVNAQGPDRFGVYEADECRVCNGAGTSRPDANLYVRMSVVIDVQVKAERATSLEARQFMVGRGNEGLVANLRKRLSCPEVLLGWLEGGERSVWQVGDLEVDRVEIHEVSEAGREGLAA
jgi:hypothetical protein